MKIVEAEVTKPDKYYQAKVTVLDEGTRYTGECTSAGAPEIAVTIAFNMAAEAIVSKVRESIAIKTEVTF